MSVKRS